MRNSENKMSALPFIHHKLKSLKFMRILLYFSGRLYEPKGTPIRVGNMIDQLQKGGFDIYYAGANRPHDFDDNHYLPLRRPLARVLDIIRFIDRNRIKIFYIQTSAGLWLAPFARVFTGAKIGVDYHSLRVEEENAYHSFSAPSYYFRKWAELFLSYFIHFGTAVCRPLKEYYKAQVGNFFILPVGVDTELFSPNIEPKKEVLFWKGDSVLIGYAGNTKWYQGVGVILEALSRMERKHPGGYKLLIISSSGAKDIENFIKENNLSKAIHLLGQQTHEDVPKYLSASDVLAIPRPSDSITEYAFPSKFPEYIALGKPVVVSRVSDIADYIEDGVSGILIRPESADDLCKALEKLKDRSLRESMGKKGRETAERVFDIDVLGKKLSEYLRKI